MKHLIVNNVPLNNAIEQAKLFEKIYKFII